MTRYSSSCNLLVVFIATAILLSINDNCELSYHVKPETPKYVFKRRIKTAVQIQILLLLLLFNLLANTEHAYNNNELSVRESSLHNSLTISTWHKGAVKTQFVAITVWQ